MIISFRAQPILRILGSGKGRKPFYINHTVHPCNLSAWLTDFVEVRIVEVSGWRVINLGYRNPSTSEIIISRSWGQSLSIFVTCTLLNMIYFYLPSEVLSSLILVSCFTCYIGLNILATCNTEMGGLTEESREKVQ